MYALFFFSPPRDHRKAGECQPSRFSPPRSDCIRQYPNQYIPFFLFCFLAALEVQLGKVYRALSYGFSPSISFWISPQLSAFHPPLAITEAHITNIYISRILISTHLPGFS